MQATYPPTTMTEAEIRMHMQSFWDAADSSKTQSEYLANKKLAKLATVSLGTLQKILVQYRYFTIYYITDLALLVARLPFGDLRSLLADFLNDELGNGAAKAAHESIYDDFLRSIGISNDDLVRDPHQGNLALLGDCQKRVTYSSPGYALGLRGMGGECLCQIYLSAMHEHFRKNPAIREMESNIDWVFWDIHTGEVDIVHREKLKEAIRAFVTREPEHLPQLVQGYRDAREIWDQFWTNIYDQYLDGDGEDHVSQFSVATEHAGVRV